MELGRAKAAIKASVTRARAAGVSPSTTTGRCPRRSTTAESSAAARPRAARPRRQRVPHRHDGGRRPAGRRRCAPRQRAARGAVRCADAGGTRCSCLPGSPTLSRRSCASGPKLCLSAEGGLPDATATPESTSSAASRCTVDGISPDDLRLCPRLEEHVAARLGPSSEGFCGPRRFQRRPVGAQGG